MTPTPENESKLNAFLEAAANYCVLCEVVLPDREQWCKELLASLVALYGSANLMPDIEILDDDQEVEAPIDVSDEEWQAVFDRMGMAFGMNRYYWTIWRCAAFDDEHPEPVVGDLADDLADIYRDVCPAVRAYQLGDAASLRSALFDGITVGLPSHWGIHALEAMRELHVIEHLSGLRDSAD